MFSLWMFACTQSAVLVVGVQVPALVVVVVGVVEAVAVAASPVIQANLLFKFSS